MRTHVYILSTLTHQCRPSQSHDRGAASCIQEPTRRSRRCSRTCESNPVFSDICLISQGDLVKVLEAEVGGVLITLRNEVPALGDSLANSPDLLGGTLGGILDNLLGGGLSKLGQ